LPAIKPQKGPKISTASFKNERYLEQIKSGLSPTHLLRQPAGALTALTDTTEQNRLQRLSYNESRISGNQIAVGQSGGGFFTQNT
jgi:hypothetical protein